MLIYLMWSVKLSRRVQCASSRLIITPFGDKYGHKKMVYSNVGGIVTIATW